jgi:hypothetical protein
MLHYKSTTGDDQNFMTLDSEQLTQTSMVIGFENKQHVRWLSVIGIKLSQP